MNARSHQGHGTHATSVRTHNCCVCRPRRRHAARSPLCVCVCVLFPLVRVMCFGRGHMFVISTVTRAHATTPPLLSHSCGKLQVCFLISAPGQSVQMCCQHLALGEVQQATPQRPYRPGRVGAAAEINELCSPQFVPFRPVCHYTNKLRNVLALKLSRLPGMVI